MATKIPRSFPSDALRKFQDRPCFWWKSGGRRVSISSNIRSAGKAINKKTQISFNRQINKQRKEFEKLHNTIFKTKFRALPKKKVMKRAWKGKTTDQKCKGRAELPFPCFIFYFMLLFLFFKTYYKSSKQSTFRIRALTNSNKMTTSTNQNDLKEKIREVIRNSKLPTTNALKHERSSRDSFPSWELSVLHLFDLVVGRLEF